MAPLSKTPAKSEKKRDKADSDIYYNSICISDKINIKVFPGNPIEETCFFVCPPPNNNKNKLGV